ISHALAEAGVNVAVGRYDEARPLYTSELFGSTGGERSTIHSRAASGGSSGAGAAPPCSTDDPRTERRTIHLGIDLFVPAGSAVHAPFDGVVYRLADNPAPLDYGPLVVLRHETDDGHELFTLYGHLSDDTLARLAVGQAVRRGERIGAVGAPPGNGGWPPHVHFQIILDLLGLDTDFPGVAYASQRNVWKALSPDPNLL